MKRWSAMVILRPPRPEDEAELEAAQERLAGEGFTFLLDRDRAAAFADYLDLLDRQAAGRDPHPERVRASFLVAQVDGRIVGRVSIRHELNQYLEREGGHIGFGVLREHRRRGYATEILRQALAILAHEGLATALVTCDDDNIASAAVIERCGGKPTDRVDVDGTLIRRYLVPTA
jgi:predicted acetyltransferase